MYRPRTMKAKRAYAQACLQLLGSYLPSPPFTNRHGFRACSEKGREALPGERVPPGFSEAFEHHVERWPCAVPPSQRRDCRTACASMHATYMSAARFFPTRVGERVAPSKQNVADEPSRELSLASERFEPVPGVVSEPVPVCFPPLASLADARGWAREAAAVRARGGCVR